MLLSDKKKPYQRDTEELIERREQRRCVLFGTTNASSDIYRRSFEEDLFSLSASLSKLYNFFPSILYSFIREEK